MQYYELSYSIDPKIVGVRDGLGPCILDADFYERHPWYEKLFITDWLVNKTPDWWKPSSTMPDYGAPLERVKVEKRAKLTDFIDFAGFRSGYLVSDRLRALLEQAHLPRHAYFPITLQQGEQEITGYWWLCYDLETGEHNVDFSRSESKNSPFDEMGIPGSEIGMYSYADYLAYINMHGHGLKIFTLYLTATFDQALDIWGTQFLTLTKGFISERLLKIFEQQRITGYGVRRIGSELTGTVRHPSERALVFSQQ